jgi:endoglucanase
MLHKRPMPPRLLRNCFILAFAAIFACCGTYVLLSATPTVPKTNASADGTTLSASSASLAILARGAAMDLPAAINPPVVAKVPVTAPSTVKRPEPTVAPSTTVGASLCSPTTTSLAIHVCDGQLVNGSGQAVQLRGVNVTGTEDACAEDGGFSWGSNNNAAQIKTSVTALLSWDINAVRVPLNEDCWLGINGVPAAFSGANYQNDIMAWVTALNNAGIYTILDLQAAGSGSVDGTYPNNWPMADADHSLTFWSQVASAYKSDPAVLYDLYNEPFIGKSTPTTSDWSCWLNGCSDPTDAPASASDYNMAGMQQLLDAVRSTGADQPVMVAGLNWETNPCQSDGDSSQACPQLSYMPKDTLSPAQLVVSWHTYGQETGTCITDSCWNNLASTMKSAGIPLVAGEFGDSDDTTGGCSYVQPFMDWADQQTPKVSYLAWAWQAVDSMSGAFDLISSWTGSPSSMSDGGPAIKSHLLGEGNISC